MEKKLIVEKGFLHDRIPFKVYQELLDSIDILDIDSKKTYNASLAGNIEKELDATSLIPNSFYEYVAFLANSYYNYFPLEKFGNKKTFKFMASWLNYQKKNEFNPLHSHEGSLSYVVWLKIPYNLKDELSLPNNVVSNGPRNSVFEFFVNDVTCPIWVDSSMEGEIIIFNSAYNHLVYPFYTSDEYRISLAGNLKTEWVD